MDDQHNELSRHQRLLETQGHHVVSQDRKSTRLELQSRPHLVCRLLLEKKKKKIKKKNMKKKKEKNNKESKTKQQKNILQITECNTQSSTKRCLTVMKCRLWCTKVMIG